VGLLAIAKWSMVIFFPRSQRTFIAVSAPGRHQVSSAKNKCLGTKCWHAVGDRERCSCLDILAVINHKDTLKWWASMTLPHCHALKCNRDMSTTYPCAVGLESTGFASISRLIPLDSGVLYKVLHSQTSSSEVKCTILRAKSRSWYAQARVVKGSHLESGLRAP
jgi:hypothetical protein